MQRKEIHVVCAHVSLVARAKVIYSKEFNLLLIFGEYVFSGHGLAGMVVLG